MGFLKQLSGKKTYIIAFLYAGVNLARAFGVEIPGWIDGMLISAGGATLRHGVSKGEQG